MGKYAETKIKQANALIEQAKQAHADGQEQQAQQLLAQAEQINQDWGEQGKLRIGLHTVIGGLTGGAAGAAGSLTGSLTAVEASRLLKENGITQENNPALYNTLVTLASTAAGGVVGGTAGAGAAFNEVTNNDLAHQVAAIVEGKKRCKTQQCQADYDKALQIAINVNGDFSSRENANTVVIGSKDHDAYYPPNQLLPQPDYSSSTGYIPLIGNVSKVVNNYSGAIYYSYGQSRPIAGTDWSSMPKPGFSFVNGYVFGAKNGMDVDNFIQGGAWSFSAFVPIPFLKSVGVGGNIVHAIGGATGVELGIGTPGYTYNPSVTICTTCKR